MLTDESIVWTSTDGIDPDLIRKDRQRSVGLAAQTGGPVWSSAYRERHGNILYMPEHCEPRARHIAADGTIVLEYSPPGFPDDDTLLAEQAADIEESFAEARRERETQGDTCNS